MTTFQRASIILSANPMIVYMMIAMFAMSTFACLYCVQTTPHAALRVLCCVVIMFNTSALTILFSIKKN